MSLFYQQMRTNFVNPMLNQTCPARAPNNSFEQAWGRNPVFHRQVTLPETLEKLALPKTLEEPVKLPYIPTAIGDIVERATATNELPIQQIIALPHVLYPTTNVPVQGSQETLTREELLARKLWTQVVNDNPTVFKQWMSGCHPQIILYYKRGHTDVLKSSGMEYSYDYFEQLFDEGLNFDFTLRVKRILRTGEINVPNYETKRVIATIIAGFGPTWMNESFRQAWYSQV